MEAILNRYCDAFEAMTGKSEAEHLAFFRENTAIRDFMYTTRIEYTETGDVSKDYLRLYGVYYQLYIHLCRVLGREVH